MTSTTTNSGTASRVSGDIGVGLISVGWMGKLHSRAYQALPWVYPDLGLRPRLVHAADTAADRVAYARDILGYRKGSSDYRDVLADPLSHVVDLVSYLVGPIAEVSALTSIVYAERPILPMGSATHFAVIQDGELGPVDNEDYAATLVRFSPTAQGPAAVGTLEASRTIVGPQCGFGVELYGTDGSAVWNFERMNELRLCLGRGGPHQGYTTVLGNAHLGDYARFQPGPGIGMGYDDLKVVEAKKFLVAVTGGERRSATVEDAHAVAEVIAAAAASAASGVWQAVPAVPGATFGRAPAPAPGPSHG